MNGFAKKLRHVWDNTINAETGEKYTVAEIVINSKKNGAQVSQAQWYKYLSGEHEPSTSKAVALARLFQVPIRYLIDESIPLDHTPRLMSYDEVKKLSNQDLEALVGSLRKMISENK